jgi:hypothetical protein
VIDIEATGFFCDSSRTTTANGRPLRHLNDRCAGFSSLPARKNYEEIEKEQFSAAAARSKIHQGE